MPRVPLDGVRLMIDALAETLAKARAAHPEDYYDNAVLDRLEASGFVAGLYR